MNDEFTFPGDGDSEQIQIVCKKSSGIVGDRSFWKC